MKKGVIIDKKKRYMIVMTQSGEIEKARMRDSSEIGEEVTYVPHRSFQFTTIYENKTFSVPLALAMVFLLMLPIYPLFQTDRVYGTVSFDVNPSVEFAVNQSYDVISTNGFNERGNDVLEQIEDQLVGKPLNQAALLLIETSNELGYLSSNDIYVSSQLSLFSQDTWGEDYDQWVSNIYDDYSVSFVSLLLDEELIQEANEYSLSPAKFLLLKEAENQGMEIEPTEVNNTSIKELEESVGESVENVASKKANNEEVKEQGSNGNENSNVNRKENRANKDEDHPSNSNPGKGNNHDTHPSENAPGLNKDDKSPGNSGNNGGPGNSGNNGGPGNSGNNGGPGNSGNNGGPGNSGNNGGPGNSGNNGGPGNSGNNGGPGNSGNNGGPGNSGNNGGPGNSGRGHGNGPNN
ncbi:anti-sigma factor domain-containing protein [Bacillus shivajii]|uniref:anti-sigma factor domain-containing protein n=1 Tax=Bacillus shivajii TaxID=1983719 RepID=UPI001CFC4050|nr:anti-sigma factor domain-containing protein [Bacillus shivajii]UCZ54847.1 anti-sigma factor domain-containing protein [Bacillus shivajii]